VQEERYGKFFSALADERLFFGLSRLNLTTNKLPKETSRLVCWALAYHEFIAPPDEGGYYFGYHISSMPILFKYS
jgi:hypothetical protein